MLEGAKSIGAGASTIALAGIISFLFLSYFFPMTTRNGQIKNFISNVSSFFYFLQLKYPYFIFFLKISIFVLLVFFRIILPLGQVLAHLTCCSSFLITLPPEIQNPQDLDHLAGLNFYLSLYEQDPEWVAFIQHELNNNTPLVDIPGRLRLFLMEERTSSLRLDLIQEFISQYARNEAVLPVVEPYHLEQAVRSYLDYVRGTDNFSILQAAYQDLRENEEGSIFFLEVVSHNQDYLDALATSRRCHELAQRILWDGIARSRAQLERAEHEHALLLFQYEDLKRGRGQGHI